MEAQPQHIAWGIAYASMMYVIGNGVWVNHLARKKQWLGWLMWLAAGLLLIVLGASIEVRLSGTASGLWQQLTSVDKENHWIVLVLFALMSVPGAASVILKQEANWTRIALIIPAIVVFIPVGMQLGAPSGKNIMAGLGLTLAVCAMLLIWQFMLDRDEPSQQEKPV
jgi:hypothetical protein